MFEMYEFSAAIFIKVLSYQSFMWSVYSKKLVAYGFHFW